MAPKFDLSKLNFFNKLDARARVFVLFGGIVGILILVYLGTVWLSGSDATTGPSRVASAPKGLQSVPGGQLTPEYYQALQQANKQAAQQAQITGGTAAPTLINTGNQLNTGAANCTVLCSEQVPNIKDLMDGWVRQGTFLPDTESQLLALADKKISVEGFADAVDQLIQSSKITPEQARQLVDVYRKQFDYALLQESAKIMDALIKSGDLPVDVATSLLDAQRKKVTSTQYAAVLQFYVTQGSITQSIAQQLLAQYSQQRARVIVGRSLAILHRMTLNGELTPEVEKAVSDLENQLVPVDAFITAVQNLQNQNKITPAVGSKVIDEYKLQKKEIGASDLLEKIVQKALNAAYQEIRDLLNANKITQEVASTLLDMIGRNVSFDEFQNTVNTLVQQKKLTPDIAKLKIADYLRIVQAKALAMELASLQANNASLADYAAALKRGVQLGLITPEEAAALMREYQALTGNTGAVPTTGTTAFNQLQQRVEQGAAAGQDVANPGQFNVPVQPAALSPATQAQMNQDRQARLAQIQQGMSNQATQLVNAWGPPAMVHKEAQPQTTTTTSSTTTTTGSGTNGTAGSSASTPSAPVIIKAGSIFFAVLETTANSDYPDAPVMATIVDGPYKGAKLLGKLQTSKNAAGQLDRIILNFTLMNAPDWPSSKTITAYGVDPDTAKTALASHVDNHYLTKYGALFGASFLQGYATAITTSGSSQVNGSLGTTTTTHPPLGTSDKLAVGFGQVGQTAASYMQNWVNIPPTVKVDAGVGLGILFMTDVS